MIQSVKILFFVAFCTPIFAQVPSLDSTGILYRACWYAGPLLSTNGFGASFTKQYRTTAKFRQGFTISAAQIKVHKETRTTNPLYSDSKSYVFGKINQLYTLNIAYSANWKLFEKKRNRGVGIRFNQQIGCTAGFLKPVYLKIREPFNQDVKIEPTDERYDPSIHPQEYIYGRSSVVFGVTESKIYYGAFLQSGIQFDFHPFRHGISLVELGCRMDLMQKPIPLFYQGKNHFLYPSLFASLQFGKNKI